MNLLPGIGGFLFSLIVVLIFLYNRFVVLRQRVYNAWSQIEVLLKRRSDLIPNLVDTVKAYAKHEQDTLAAITAARNIALSAGKIEEHAQAESELTGALRSLFAVAEAYPELQADNNFLALQKELAETENKITFSRQFYNDTVQKYNTKIQLFPNNFVARVFKFKEAEYFNVSESDVLSAVQVRFQKGAS